MRQIIIILFLLFGSLNISAAQQKVVIETTLGNGVEESLKSIFMSALSTGLTNSGEYIVLANRKEYALKISGEMEAQASGLVSDDQLSDFGRVYGADMVVYVKIDSFDQDYFITVSMINVESGVADKTIDPILTNRAGILRSAQDLAITLTKGAIAGEEPKQQKGTVVADAIQAYIEDKEHPAATYQEASDACKSKGEDWRLPTVDELEVLYNQQYYTPSIYGKPFQKVNYWSSTKRNNFSVMTIDFSTGNKTYISTTMRANYRCVRSK